MIENPDRPIFEVLRLIKTIDGKTILSIDELSFYKGRVYCLYGPNGSGKTTLFELLTLLKKPTEGKIFFKGIEVYPDGKGVTELRSQVTLVHQNPLLFDTTVEKNVDYGLRIRKVAGHERKLRVVECLKIVGLEGFQKRKARELSGGEAQRVAIARALSIDPAVLFLDEFSASIDSEHRLIIENIIKTLNERFKITIVFTTHYMDQAYRMSDHVIHLFNGKSVTSHISNIFRGAIRKTDKGFVFENNKVRLFVSSSKSGPTSIAVPLNSIIISKGTLESSMRNRLKGKITHIMDDGMSVVLKVLAGELFEAVITKESFRNMGLEPGAEVYLNIKASSVEVL